MEVRPDRRPPPASRHRPGGPPVRRPALLTAALAALALVGGCTIGGSEPDPAASSAPAPSASTPSASASPSSSATAAPDGPVVLALGDSLAAGYQPGGSERRDTAYPALAAARVSQGGTELGVENLACSGETTGTLLEGGRCDYAEGSQLAQAEAFLRERGADVRMVTLDIGGNDLLRCAARLQVDAACAEQGVQTVAKNLPTIVERLRAAAGPDVPVLVLGYYNPGSRRPTSAPARPSSTPRRRPTPGSTTPSRRRRRPPGRATSGSTPPSRSTTSRRRPSTAARSRPTSRRSAPSPTSAPPSTCT